LVFAAFFLTSPAGAENIYKAGWTKASVAKMKLNCTKDLSSSALKKIESNKSLTKQKMDEELDYKLERSVFFCDCVWDRISRQYSVEEYEIKTKRITPEEKARFFIGEFETGECRKSFSIQK
jgi:hypothetical protein